MKQLLHSKGNNSVRQPRAVTTKLSELSVITNSLPREVCPAGFTLAERMGEKSLSGVHLKEINVQNISRTLRNLTTTKAN